ncbi:HV03 protein, partial [Indicator maculatus]|nr:HV03 protein [Indicator maculatus]
AVHAQLRLVQAGGGLRASGDSVSLHCRGHGFERFSAVWWYRQAAGGRLQWVSYISHDSSVVQFWKSVERRAMASRDNSQTVTSLSLRTLQPQDSAHYFCAVTRR